MPANVRGLPQEAHQKHHLDENPNPSTSSVSDTTASCGKPLLAAGPFISSERCIKVEIIQELGRALLLHGAKSDYLSTVWSCGDTLEDEDVLELLRGVNDTKLKDVRSMIELATPHSPPDQSDCQKGCMDTVSPSS
jgi:hypothetical protein